MPRTVSTTPLFSTPGDFRDGAHIFVVCCNDRVGSVFEAVCLAILQQAAADFMRREFAELEAE